jgi:hypothetical protein
VREIDDTHDLKLLVQSLFCIGVRGGIVAVGRQLELQVCDNAAPAQRFAFDGDAILMGTQSDGRVSRNFVIEPELDYTRPALRLSSALVTFPTRNTFVSRPWTAPRRPQQRDLSASPVRSGLIGLSLSAGVRSSRSTLHSRLS